MDLDRIASVEVVGKSTGLDRVAVDLDRAVKGQAAVGATPSYGGPLGPFRGRICIYGTTGAQAALVRQ